ncbi:TIGR00341 family protein [Thiorhodococcus mannitoliphagus]|uniref:TIGR00341 family protein n=1 Tax=Thiorhodococcus mannitoliphagus TaxID=329406 RepID=A0A6P1DQ71_9GAMM|nr:TIGR00341 family protein [Thiorhodococcus mannitoliphagus]NEX18806.1 TIGR00341 family protein [Thiorhodococcus mannitoliphagus]
MKYVEVIANAGSADTIAEAATQAKASDFRLGVVGEDGMQQMRMLVSDSRLQRLLDILQSILGAQPTARIVVLPVEVSIPQPDEGERKEEDSATAARESLYEGVEKSARLDGNYALLVVLSTVVAAIGLIEDNVAVVIGAMVIAPLLGPNLALSLGTALGDIGLMKKAVATLSFGIVVAVALSAALAYLWPSALTSDEVLARTSAGLESVALALASGAAAALSLTTGLSSVLVGVMVAVALLPPAATLGLMLGDGRFDLASGAGLLLAVNVVCVNLASKIVFFTKGVSPRKWLEKEKAKRAMVTYVLVWVLTLLVLIAVILKRDALLPQDLDQAIEEHVQQPLERAY